MPTQTPSSVYYLRSDTDPNLFYTVAQVDSRCACGQRIAGLLHCSCPDHVHRARDCKHVRRVLAGEIVPATVKAVPVAAPRSLPVDDLYGDGGAAVGRGVAARRQAVAS